jgi:hypothetical protein
MFGKVLFEYSCKDNNIKTTVEKAVAEKATLYSANLRFANLRYADLRSANLSSADLRFAKNLSVITQAETVITPEGDIIGWKKCRENVIIKLLIPSKAKRSNSTTRKCRAEYVKILDVLGAKKGISIHNEKVEYIKGNTVKCDKWGKNRFEECSGGIHFFLTKIEAENYN